MEEIIGVVKVSKESDQPRPLARRPLYIVTWSRKASLRLKLLHLRQIRSLLKRRCTLRRCVRRNLWRTVLFQSSAWNSPRAGAGSFEAASATAIRISLSAPGSDVLAAKITSWASEMSEDFQEWVAYHLPRLQLQHVIDRWSDRRLARFYPASSVTTFPWSKSARWKPWLRERFRVKRKHLSSTSSPVHQSEPQLHHLIGRWSECVRPAKQTRCLHIDDGDN